MEINRATEKQSDIQRERHAESETKRQSERVSERELTFTVRVSTAVTLNV